MNKTRENLSSSLTIFIESLFFMALLVTSDYLAICFFLLPPPCQFVELSSSCQIAQIVEDGIKL